MNNAKHSRTRLSQKRKNQNPYLNGQESSKTQICIFLRKKQVVYTSVVCMMDE